MVKYEKYTEGEPDKDCKFIRVGEDIHITKPRDFNSSHRQLVIDDGLQSRLNEAAPLDLDAGFMSTSEWRNRKTLTIDGRSETLGLPRYLTARQKTLVVLGKKFPEFEIKELDKK